MDHHILFLLILLYTSINIVSAIDTNSILLINVINNLKLLYIYLNSIILLLYIESIDMVLYQNIKIKGTFDDKYNDIEINFYRNN